MCETLAQFPGFTVINQSKVASGKSQGPAWWGEVAAHVCTGIAHVCARTTGPPGSSYMLGLKGWPQGPA